MFYANFIVGFEKLVGKIFKEKYPETKILQTFNGAILYETPNKKEVSAPFLNNQFIVFDQSKETDIGTFINGLDCSGLEKPKDKKGFRVIVSDKSELVSISESILGGLENKIKSKTGNYINRRKPDIEYWVLRRSEGTILFMERIGKHKSFDKVLEKGELREDLCYFLNYLSKPHENDVYLDCFCGSGAIIKSRIKSKFNMIFGIDTNKEHISKLKKVFKKQNNVIFKNIDFFKNNFNNDFVDKVVTDPPWGFYEEIDNIGVFYQKIFDEVTRLLKPDGLFILLSARKDEVKNTNTPLKLLEQYDILVSGKKVGAYVFQKRPSNF